MNSLDVLRRTAERYEEPKVGIAVLEIMQFVPKDEFVGSSAGIEKVNLMVLTDIGQVADDTHQRRNAYATANQHDALMFRAGERELSRWRSDVKYVADFYVFMQVARD